MSKSYKPHKAGKNLNWKIGVLEAQAGLDPSIEIAKAAARSKGEVDREAAEKELNRLKAEKISRKTFHLKKEIRKSLKRAKTFETQKIVKRIKSARNGLTKGDAKEDAATLEATIKRLERELEMTKSIQTDQLCDLAFYKAIKKNNTLRNHEAFTSLAEPKGTCVENEEPEAAKLRSNVESRIFGSKPLKDIQAICVGDLLNIIAPEENTERLFRHHQLIKQEDSSVESENEESEIDADSEIEAELQRLEQEYKRGASEMESDEEEEGDDNGEEEEVVTLPKAKTSKGKTPKTQTQKDRKKVKKQKTDPDAVPNTSVFMDSLGGYQSSDPEDYEDEAFDKIYGKVKKNRPGQRARKMMWERIHGNNANHIKAQLAAEKQAAQEAKWRDQQTYGDADRKPKRGAAEKLHPSWEAKRHQKNAAARPFQGTKITFDEDAGGNSNSNSNSNNQGAAPKSATLHPSWEAKRRQKEAQAALATVKNTKIVFDSD
ncbi:hypothetical protein K493DRAFT_404374 [Basidiobolus meristosporus CBS 931.73]|uniref:Bud22 domain-containing protein n=1 Tax=Basidiobolus meristosporus CBS 931.73 TaxID=1314790 RepID=A0A1Y1Z4V2_9FUNG|nr:hypothetical protein K493DRAFT_404374 [Basidiobolus meristosporus CBS 931.73]|eukprot:ORY05332.1 hypothetical protein K493DRAFT_404374 [Basidiobolus meristosporus CBS 931.73]